jgi:hypothetical protein
MNGHRPPPIRKAAHHDELEALFLRELAAGDRQAAVDQARQTAQTRKTLQAGIDGMAAASGKTLLVVSTSFDWDKAPANDQSFRKFVLAELDGVNPERMTVERTPDKITISSHHGVHTLEKAGSEAVLRYAALGSEPHAVKRYTFQAGKVRRSSKRIDLSTGPDFTVDQTAEIDSIAVQLGESKGLTTSASEVKAGTELAKVVRQLESLQLEIKSRSPNIPDGAAIKIEDHLQANGEVGSASTFLYHKDQTIEKLIVTQDKKESRTLRVTLRPDRSVTSVLERNPIQK